MGNTMLIQLTNLKAIKLLHDMADLELIKVLQENISTTTNNAKLSDKYRGSISKEQGENLNEHIKQMRKEWNDI